MPKFVKGHEYPRAILSPRIEKLFCQKILKNYINNGFISFQDIYEQICLISKFSSILYKHT